VTAPLVLTVDELRALHRVTGAWVPTFVAEDDSRDSRVDVAALRGLAARGLVDLVPDAAGEFALADRLAGHLAPYRDARLVAEVEVEDPAALHQYAVGGADTVGLLTELAGGLTTLRLPAASASRAIVDLCRLGEVAARPGTSTGFEVDAEAHTEADDLALAGDRDAAVEHLVRAGAPMAAAAAWIDALTKRRCAAAVRVGTTGEPHPAAGGTYTGGELRWLVGGDGTAWRVSLRHTGAADDVSPAVSVLAPVGAADLLRRLDELTTPAPEGAR